MRHNSRQEPLRARHLHTLSNTSSLICPAGLRTRCHHQWKCPRSREGSKPRESASALGGGGGENRQCESGHVPPTLVPKQGFVIVNYSSARQRFPEHPFGNYARDPQLRGNRKTRACRGLVDEAASFLVTGRGHPPSLAMCYQFYEAGVRLLVWELSEL